MTDQTDAFLTAWTTAEQVGDVRTLDQLLTAGFYGVGPMGFILPKTAWLARHQAGDLAYTRFGLDQVQAAGHGEVTVVTGTPVPAPTRTAPSLKRPGPPWSSSAKAGRASSPSSI